MTQNYYEVLVADKGAKKVIKQILLLVGLFLFFLAFMLIIFSFILTYYLLIPFAVLAFCAWFLGSFAHLLSKDFLYIVRDNTLIIKYKSGGVTKEIDNIKLDDINAVQMLILQNAIKYTPHKHGVTLMTNDKNYTITPDDYLLAMLTKDRLII